MASNILLTKENLREFLDSVETVLTDCDGVLWNGSEAIEGAPETIQKLKAMGKRIFYVTNNSAKTREEYANKCNGLQFPAKLDDIIGSSYVTAQYIKHTLGYRGKIYMIGSTGLEKELQLEGFTVIGRGQDDLDTMDPNKLSEYQIDPEIGCVVVGYDPLFNYAKLFKASSHLQQPGCHFIGTNIDSGLPMGEKAFLPGTGSIVKAVEVASERRAIIMGKPSKPIFDIARQMHHIQPASTIMIGDRLNTDIELGHNCGFRTLHVHTGYHKLADVEQLMSSEEPQAKSQVPHYYLPSMQDLGILIQQVYTN